MICRPITSLVALSALLGALSGCGTAGLMAKARVPMNASAHSRTGNGPLTLVTMPEAGVNAVVDAIKSAKKTIRLKMYMFTGHGATQLLIAALSEQAKAGVDVQVMLEARPYLPPSAPDCKPSNESPNAPTIKALLAAGCRVKYANPKFRFTHEKSIVVDDQVGYIMTLNFSNSGLTSNREYMIIDREPSDVAEMVRIYQADWSEDRETRYVPQDPDLVVSPENSRSRLLSLIDSAQREIVIQVEYLTDPEVASHLGRKVKAGADVTVMLSDVQPSPCFQSDMAAEEAKLLKSVGVTKFAFLKNIKVHAKMIIVDGERAFVGSENLTSNSLNNNRELGIIVKDRAIVSELQAVARKDWDAKALAPAFPVSAGEE